MPRKPLTDEREVGVNALDEDHAKSPLIAILPIRIKLSPKPLV